MYTIFITRRPRRFAMTTQELEALYGQVVRYSLDRGNTWTYAVLHAPPDRKKFFGDIWPSDFFEPRASNEVSNGVHSSRNLPLGLITDGSILIQATTPEEVEGKKFSYTDYEEEV